MKKRTKIYKEDVKMQKQRAKKIDKKATKKSATERSESKKIKSNNNR